MHITALLLSRLQFAFTISFHIIFPSFTIGLAAFLTLLEALHLATGRPTYRVVFGFWLKVFAVAFGITGSVLASFLFEWLRRPSRDRTAEGSGPPPPHTPGRARVPGGWPALAAVILIGYARVRRTRVRHR